MASNSDDTKSTSPKVPVVRGARACTVCRAAKMKCVGAEDGQRPCQRCKRANLECIFEKHRRGRKPGSKLSEASKMLRRLEKGLNSAKLKSHAADASPYPSSDPHPSSSTQEPLYTTLRPSEDTYSSPTSHFQSNELPPLNFSNCSGADYPSHGSATRSVPMDGDEDEPDRNEETIYPANLIRREHRNSFFKTILNPEEAPSIVTPSNSGHPHNFTPPQLPRLIPPAANLADPITAGIVSEEDAKVLFDLIYLRLNPFINLFDPVLHSVNYVRSKCPFLFTTLLMAGCKFFKPEAYKQCQKLANEYVVRAFAEAWKRVEVVQAFACLTYWKNPDDNRTWTYIGYACRMAVELGLNRYVANPPPNETEFQLLERRNRERTYLVLFVHDRSLSTQTGRHWMLPEDELIRHSLIWHKQGGSIVRPEDAIIASFVSLRRVAAETTDVFSTSTESGAHHDVNYEVVLRNCNAKLTTWADEWKHEVDRAGGQKFHLSFLSLFRLHVRLFLNCFALLSPSNRQSPSLQALSTCCSSALESLRIVSEDFRSMSMLRYGQDSILVMSAYSAIILLKLLRNPATASQLNGNTAQDIHALILKTAEAYQDAAQLSPESTPAAYHARFLRNLVANDVYKARLSESDKRRENGIPLDPRLAGQNHGPQTSPIQYSQAMHAMHHEPPSTAGSSAPPPFHFTSTSTTTSTPSAQMSITSQQQSNEYVPSSESANANGVGGFVGDASAADAGGGDVGGYHSHHHSHPVAPSHHPQHAPQHASELDAHYWKNMFIELGFGDNGEGQNLHAAAAAAAVMSESRGANIGHFGEMAHHAPPPPIAQHHHSQHQHQPHHHPSSHLSHHHPSQHQPHHQQSQHRPSQHSHPQSHMSYQPMHPSSHSGSYGR